MAYNEKVKVQNMKYMEEKQLRVPLNWLKEDFEKRVKPAIKRSGMPVATFIKAAVNEKIDRDELDDTKHEIMPELKHELLDMDISEQQKILGIIQITKK